MAKRKTIDPWAELTSQLIAFNLFAHNLERIRNLINTPGLILVNTEPNFPYAKKTIPKQYLIEPPPGLEQADPTLVIYADTSEKTKPVVSVRFLKGKQLAEFCRIPHTDPYAPVLRKVLAQHFDLVYPENELEVPD